LKQLRIVTPHAKCLACGMEQSKTNLKTKQLVDVNGESRIEIWGGGRDISKGEGEIDYGSLRFLTLP